VRSIDVGFAEARRFGTTSIANLTGVPELASRTHPLSRTWWFAELIDIRAAQNVDEVLRTLPVSAEGRGLAPHAPYTVSADLYRKCEAIAERENLLLTTHLAESKEEMAMSLDRCGPLSEFLVSISPDLFEASRITPVEHLSRFCRLDERWLLVHVNEVRDRDFERLGNAHIVHCPRSHAYFRHTPFEMAKLRSRGFNICLGTDSLASNDDLSLFAEMRQFRKIHPSLPGVDLLEMVTVNPARALRREGVLGRLRSGHRADMIALSHTGSARSLIDEVIAFDGTVSWSMIDGVLLENT
nr:amidohydrolase family protein [Verrucomicrobiota bacterium]